MSKLLYDKVVQELNRRIQLNKDLEDFEHELLDCDDELSEFLSSSPLSGLSIFSSNQVVK